MDIPLRDPSQTSRALMMSSSSFTKVTASADVLMFGAVTISINPMPVWEVDSLSHVRL